MYKCFASIGIQRAHIAFRSPDVESCAFLCGAFSFGLSCVWKNKVQSSKKKAPKRAARPA